MNEATSEFVEKTSGVVDGAKDAASAGADAAAEEIGMFAQYFTAERLMGYAGIGIRILVLIIVLIITWRVTRYMLRRVMARQQRRADAGGRAQLSTASHLMESILGYLMLFLGIIGVLSIFGFDMRGLVASAGVAGLIIAFVSQSIIKDWVSGLFIIIEHQHNVGDWVRIGNYEGEVLTVGMRSTVIRTWENETIYIPNGTIAEVINLSKAPQRGILDLSIAPDEDSAQVVTVLESVADSLNECNEDVIAEPISLLGIQRLERDAVVWRLTFTAHDQCHFRIMRELRREVKEALEQANIEMPYPLITLRDAAERKEAEDAH